MARAKFNGNTGVSGSTGLKEFDVVGFNDYTNDVEKNSKGHDLYVVLEFQSKDSDFTDKIWIIQKEIPYFANGNIDDTKFYAMNELHNFFDLIGFAGGFDEAGPKIDASGNIVEDFNECVSNHLASMNGTVTIIGYTYREYNAVTHKVYNRMYKQIWEVNQINKAQDTIQKLIAGKRIKVASPEQEAIASGATAPTARQAGAGQGQRRPGQSGQQQQRQPQGQRQQQVQPQQQRQQQQVQQVPQQQNYNTNNNYTPSV